MWTLSNQDEEPLAGKKGKVTLDARVGSKHTRQRQTGRGREKVWTKYWCGTPLFTCHYPKSKSMVLEFLTIFSILILSILLSQWLYAVKSRSTNQRLIRRSEGKAKILQEMPEMASQASKKMHAPLCGAPAKMTHHQCEGPRLNRIVWFKLVY